MIRFQPDSLLEAVLRPLVMALPDGWVYVEIAAPDFRFALVLLFAALLGIHLLRSRRRESLAPSDRALRALGLLTAVAFVPWLVTTGNGRYFMPMLLLVGPLCIGLAARLPATPAMRAFAVTFALVLQAFALGQNSPWKPFDGWEWTQWRGAPYFQIDVSPVANDENVTYVTISNLSFSLVAPLFPKSSRWVNLSQFDTAANGNDTWQYKPVAAMLREGKVRLFQRAQVNAMDPKTLQPTAHAVDVINADLQAHRLKVAGPESCRLLRSSTLGRLTQTTSDVVGVERQEIIGRAGFWVCDLERLANQPLRQEPTPAQVRAGKIFAVIEAACPRFLPPGQSGVGTADNGLLVRLYSESDSVLMLTADDELYMKYLRSMNPQLLGRGADVLKPGFHLDCNFRGRAGLPWEREI